MTTDESADRATTTCSATLFHPEVEDGGPLLRMRLGVRLPVGLAIAPWTCCSRMETGSRGRAITS